MIRLAVHLCQAGGKTDWAAVAWLVLSLTACRNTTRSLPPAQPDSGPPLKWAQVIAEPGLPNFHKVSDDLYRGAQPTFRGLRRLPSLGIKTVVNVRSQDIDRELLRGVPIGYVYMPTSPWQPRDREVIEFLRIARDKTRTPVFLHCEHGADRTGMLCAMYRIAVQGWSKDQAIDEMTRGGLGFNSAYSNLIEYVQKADVEKFKRQIWEAGP